MKKAIVGILILAVVVFGTLYLYKKGTKPQAAMEASVKSGETEWRYEKTIAEPIKKVSTSSEDVALGDVDQNSVSVSIPKNSFDTDTEVELKNPDAPAKYLGSEIDTIGAPIEINAGSPVRLNDKATINYKFDKNKLPEGSRKEELRIMYYDGAEWEYIKPSSVDFDNGQLTFETYHFSPFGLGRIKSEDKITEKFIHDAAVDKELKGKMKAAPDQIASQVVSLTLSKMNITDETTRSKVVDEMMKDGGYKDIQKGLAGDDPDAQKKLGDLVSTKIAENVPTTILDKGMSLLTKDVKELSTSLQSDSTDAKIKGAAKFIGGEITSQFIVGKAGKIAVAIINTGTDSWKNAEVEAAYDAYKNGADGKFWGYNVDKGDFDAVWTQMRGINRQLTLEAIKKQNEARGEAGLLPLTSDEEDTLRGNIKDTFRAQFEMRSQSEDKIAQAQAQLKLVADAFKKADFFSDSLGPEGLDKGFDYENKLAVLMHFADKIMADTNRSEIIDRNGLTMENAISPDDIVQGARFYFSGPDGKKQYAQFLKDRFNIDPFPKLKDLSGSWKGTMVITDVILSDEAKKEMENNDLKGPDGQGCDLSKLEELKGKSQPMDFTLTPTSDTGGDFITSGSSGKTTSFTYADGVVSTSMSEQDMTGSMSLMMSQDKDSYIASGSMNASYKNDLLKIVGSINASKGK